MILSVWVIKDRDRTVINYNMDAVMCQYYAHGDLAYGCVDLDVQSSNQTII